MEDDIDVGQFREYLSYVLTSPDALKRDKRPPMEQMRALGLLDPHDTPTVTAILLLGKEPQMHFPSACIQFVRFDGNSVTDSVINHEKLNGTLPQQVRDLNVVLKNNIMTGLATDVVTHTKMPDYPHAALRELTHNAVVHRDYGLSAPIRIYWFSSRIEIICPGAVLSPVKKEDFGNSPATSYRNLAIAGALTNLGFMESFGIGIAIAREALTENGNPEPEFAAYDNYTYVKIAKSAK